MTKDMFRKHLVAAANGIVEATRSYVTNHLPSEVLFLIVPNCSFDGNPLEDDEEVFPNDSLPTCTTKPPTNADGVIADLYRSGKVPEWIDVHVDSADENYTYIRLECCGRFTGLEKHLYHVGSGIPPFSTKIQLPSLDYELETQGKFPLKSRYNITD